ncbi:MAG: 50S ribosomal protein L9 [Dehalococcoidia bacterium]|nr:50S ribosomal protein L9 [Dehalococcoidia bacterium]
MFTVKVVFLESVEGSGAMGDVKDVANGYARNFLLPRGLAAPATPHVLRRAETLAAIEAERQRVQDEQARELVGKLADRTLVVAVRVGEQGRLYGSVTNGDIAEKAGEILGEELDRRRILLPEVIRSVGLYTVPIRLSRNVTASVQVAVVDVEAPEGVETAVQRLLAPPLEAEPAAAPAVTAVGSTGDASAAGASEPGNDTSTEPASAPGSARTRGAAGEDEPAP